jgi:hypothetical protein
LPENGNSAGFKNIVLLLKIRQRTKSQKIINIVPVKCSHAVFSLLDFLILEDGTDRLSQNVGTELSLYAALYLISLHISHDYLAMLALVWFHMVQFRAIQFGTVWFTASYANIR